MALVTLPRQLTVDVNGEPRVGALLSVYDAGTNNTRPVYTTKAFSVELSQPITSVEGGIFPAVYINPAGGDYKLVIQDAAGQLVYTEDNVPAQIGATDLDLEGLAQESANTAILESLDQTDAETSTAVAPANYAYLPAMGVDVRRFGVIGDGVADDSVAMATAISTGQPLDLGDLAVRIVTKLIFNKADQHVYARGGGFRFDGPQSQRLADVTASGVEFHGVDFDGNAKQVNGALVYVATDSQRAKFLKCRFRRVNGTHVGGTATLASNNQYALLLSFYGVMGFEVDGCLFEDISNDNSGANGVTPTTGRGFCGGIMFCTDDFLTPTTLQTTPTAGRIHGCTFNNIRTVMAGGLSSADQQSFNDADGIRFFGERATAQIQLPVVVQSCTFYNCGKRAVKNSEAAGTIVRDITVIATTALQYPMVCALKVDGDNQIVDGVNIRVPAAAPVRIAIQSHNCTYLRVENVEVNFCDQLWDVSPTDVNYVTRGWRVKNLQATSCTFFGIRSSTNCNSYIDCLFEGIEVVAASGVHDFTGFRIGAQTDRLELTLQNSRIEGGDVKVNGYGWTLRNIYQEINDSSYTGASTTIAMLEAGLTPQTSVTRDSHLENYELNIKALPDAYLSVSRPYLWLIYGNQVKVKNFKVTVPEALTPSFAHGSFGGGDDMSVNDFEYSGQNFIRVGDTFTGPHRRLNIHGARRVGGTVGDNEFLYLNNGQDCEIGDVFDGRNASAGTISVNGGTVSASHSYAYIIDGVRSFSTGASIIADSGGKALITNVSGFDGRNLNTLLGLVDGIAAPSTQAGIAQQYVDTADGDLKEKFGDGTTKVVSADT